jgi:hypothetical protein
MAFRRDTRELRRDTLAADRNGSGVWLGGVTAGVIAGLGMAVVTMLYTSFAGLGALLPLRMIAATFFGVDALVGGAGVLAAGLVFHLVISAFFGLLFAALTVRPKSTPVAFFGGLAYGIGIWALMTFLVLPFVNPVMAQRVALMFTPWLLAHAVYGGLLVLTPLLRVRFGYAPEETHITTVEERRDEEPPLRRAG